MIDCPSAEIRDLLPDLVHERLDVPARATVLAHVEGCAACRAELALLRDLRVELSRAPSLDVGVIARVVVSRTVRPHDAAIGAAGSIRPVRAHRWMDWRIAAAITVLVVGGASVATIRLAGRGQSAVDTAPAIGIARKSANNDSGREKSTPVVSPAATVDVTPATAELSMGGGVGDLSDGDLRALLVDIEALDGVPEPDPEPVTVRVSLPGSR